MSLRILDQFAFAFYGDHFTVALAGDRKLYVPMEALCRSMGLQTHGQVRRIRENEAVSDALTNLTIAWAYGDGLTILKPGIVALSTGFGSVVQLV